MTPLDYYLWSEVKDKCYPDKPETIDALKDNIREAIGETKLYTINVLKNWPPWSCDLTPLDYYLWGAVKDKCYADKPETIEALKDNIREAIGEIQLHTILNRSCGLLHGHPRQPFV